MMTPEQEGQLITLMITLEKRLQDSDGQIDGVSKAVGALSARVDKFIEKVFSVEAELGRQSGRLHNVENRIVRLENSVDDVVTTTGEHNLSDIEKQCELHDRQLKIARESSRYWLRFAVKTAVTIALLLAVAIAGWLARGVF